MYYTAQQIRGEVMRMDEEVVLLEEQLAAAHTDIERLQARLTELEEGASRRENETAELRRQVESAQEGLLARDDVIAGHAEEIEALRGALDAGRAEAREAASRYRDSVLAREPELPADLVAGETVADIDAAIGRARQTVAQVRQHLEQQAQAVRVPSGAPARGSPDASALSATEKIRLGLQQS